MPKRQTPRRLKRWFLLAQQGGRICTVSAYAIRSVALPDDEFANLATQDDVPDLIPRGEIWIARENLEVEGISCIANALAQLKQRDLGSSGSLKQGSSQ